MGLARASSVVKAVAGSLLTISSKSQVAVMLQSSSVWPEVASSLSLMVLSLLFVFFNCERNARCDLVWPDHESMRLAPDSLLTLIRLNVQKDRSRQPEIPLPKCPQSR